MILDLAGPSELSRAGSVAPSFQFLKWKLVSSTQQLIFITLFIIGPVSSDQTDFIRDSNTMSKGN